MRKQIVGGKDTELGRQKCRGGCKQRVKPGQVVLTEFFPDAVHSKRHLVYHPSCLAALLEDVPHAPTPGPREEAAVEAEYERVRQVLLGAVA